MVVPHKWTEIGAQKQQIKECLQVNLVALSSKFELIWGGIHIIYATYIINGVYGPDDVAK